MVQASEAEQARLFNPYFKYGVKLIPRFDKKKKGGEDAYVVSDRLIVVADGVGGWEMHGINSGLFSRELCANIKRLFDEDPTRSLKYLLIEAVKLQTHIGSSTAVLAKFDQKDPSLLLTTNLGDSGYMLCRIIEDKEGN